MSKVVLLWSSVARDFFHVERIETKTIKNKKERVGQGIVKLVLNVPKGRHGTAHQGARGYPYCWAGGR